MKIGQNVARTDPGRKRRGNEDSYVIQPPLFAIADGMGGAKAGEVASALAASALEDRNPAQTGRAHVVDLIQEANRRVHERATTDAATTGMGTTMTVALVETDGTVTFGHVGDSRAYRLRGDTLEQLTDDHSLVAELVRRGELSPQAAEVHPQRSVITRALGTDPDVDVDTFSVETRPGDLFLLCSDGLTAMVDDNTILREVERNRSELQSAAKALVRASNKGGGDHNITVVFFEIAGSGSDGVTERTVALPPVEDDEDATLSDLDRVPPIAVEEHERRDKGHPGRNAILAVVGLLVILAVLGGAVWGLWRSHFVGAEPDGHVAVYQGLPWNVVGNVRLYRAVYVSPLLTAQLSQAERKRLFNHHLTNESDARAKVRHYEEQIGDG